MATITGVNDFLKSIPGLFPKGSDNSCLLFDEENPLNQSGQI